MQTSLGGYGLPVVFACLVLLIQDGITYYVSVQTAALVFLASVLLQAGLIVRFTCGALVVYVMFSLFLLGTAVLMPDTISQNSSDILITVMGILGYVALMLAMTNLRLVRAEWILLFYRRSATAIIVAIVTLVAITDLDIIPGLTREYFIYQNVGLITNYTTMDVLEADFAAREAMGVAPDIDLFYGEQSFLSLVIFASLVSYAISSRALRCLQGEVAGPTGEGDSWGVSSTVLIGGVACMVYIQSFSSLFYALTLLGFVSINVLRGNWAPRLSLVRAVLMLFMVLSLTWVACETGPYYLYRLTTISESLSAQQRFGILLDFLPQDFIFGLHEPERMPPFGFQNGIIYLVMTGGVGGIFIIIYILNRIARLAHPLGLATLSVLAVIAVFSQNGAILSPNKLIILSFLFIPLITREPVSMTSRLESFKLVRIDDPLFS